MQLVQYALDLLWQAHSEHVDDKILSDAVDQIESLVPVDVSDCERAATEAVGGWVFFLTSVYSTLRCLLGQKPSFWALESAENAVNAFYHRAEDRFMREQGKRWYSSDESEVRANSPEIAQEIEFQWRCLERCQQGQPISRQSPP
ncbi:hypothetical protein ACYFX5_05400 [Bremerella sp. T1]|uniref:hypothetical protein n=1 Tax=Bremerella sp. TYQ1 TaxID=3119568 RepID=UPI001CC93B8A|nr:hypothetical protein [Bremerella volcania]UBM37693.1 hypothetical protein LA756_07340 [Bremerella volcania]